MTNARHRPAALLLTLALLAALVMPGCEADHSAARMADFTRLTGELEAYEQASLDQTWQACKTAMDRLAFIVTQEDLTDLEGRMIAKTQGGREVRIRLSKETTVITKVRIRVDTLGDEPLSRVVLAQIEAALPKSAAAGAQSRR